MNAIASRSSSRRWSARSGEVRREVLLAEGQRSPSDEVRRGGRVPATVDGGYLDSTTFIPVPFDSGGMGDSETTD